MHRINNGPVIQLDHYSPDDDLELLVKMVLIINYNDFEDSSRDHVTGLVESIFGKWSSNLNQHFDHSND